MLYQVEPGRARRSEMRLEAGGASATSDGRLAVLCVPQLSPIRCTSNSAGTVRVNIGDFPNHTTYHVYRKIKKHISNSGH